MDVSLRGGLNLEIPQNVGWQQQVDLDAADAESRVARRVTGLLLSNLNKF